MEKKSYHGGLRKKLLSNAKSDQLKSTLRLAQLVVECYPSFRRMKRIHPATKTFQALRIAVNRELDVLLDILPRVAKRLEMNGSFAVISFHSLEDRLVKSCFKKLAAKTEAPFYQTNKKPILPSPGEIFENSRSRKC